MGSSMWSYKDMCFEADRLLHEKDKIDSSATIEEIEKRLENIPHDSKFYYYCGVASSNVIHDINENGSCDEFNAAIGGLSMFENFIGLEVNDE